MSSSKAKGQLSARTMMRIAPFLALGVVFLLSVGCGKSVRSVYLLEASGYDSNGKPGVSLDERVVVIRDRFQAVGLADVAVVVRTANDGTYIYAAVDPDDREQFLSLQDELMVIGAAEVKPAEVIGGR